MRDTFIPMHMNYLTEEQRNTILQSHLFLKEKSEGTQKVRAVAGGNNHIYFIPKEDANSPILTTESVILTCIVDTE